MVPSEDTVTAPSLTPPEVLVAGVRIAGVALALPLVVVVVVVEADTLAMAAATSSCRSSSCSSSSINVSRVMSIRFNTAGDKSCMSVSVIRLDSSLWILSNASCIYFSIRCDDDDEAAGCSPLLVEASSLLLLSAVLRPFPFLAVPDFLPGVSFSFFSRSIDCNRTLLISFINICTLESVMSRPRLRASSIISGVGLEKSSSSSAWRYTSYHSPDSSAPAAVVTPCLLPVLLLLLPVPPLLAARLSSPSPLALMLFLLLLLLLLLPLVLQDSPATSLSSSPCKCAGQY
mmetsp:Transcript_15787/g.26536  ORF Transcript_15787/g.26536 Transcript_15787/m.26536 type:complete len:288 (-) Transcript_15787:377-1240(-)